MGIRDLFEQPAPAGVVAFDSKTPLSRAPLVFLDVETTGLSAWAGHRVCEIALVRCTGKRETDRLESLVNPRRSMPPDARAINGISDAMVAHSPPFEALAARVASLLDGAVIVAHNAPFDLSFVSREFAAGGVRMPSSPAIDTLLLARRRFPSGGNSLGSVARRLGVRAPAHRALADVLTTREVFWRLLEPIAGRSATIGDALRVQGTLAPDADDESSEAAGGATSTGGEGPMPALAADLVRALRDGERVRVVYRGASGKTTERTIDPMTIVDYGGECVVVAYCHLRRAERTFTVSRIVSWVAAAVRPSGRSSGGD